MKKRKIQPIIVSIITLIASIIVILITLKVGFFGDIGGWLMYIIIAWLLFAGILGFYYLYKKLNEKSNREQ